MIGEKILKTGHVIVTTPIKGWSVMPRLSLDIVYLHTKFGDPRFSRSADMIAGVKIENGSCDPEHSTFRGGLSPKS